MVQIKITIVIRKIPSLFGPSIMCVLYPTHCESCFDNRLQVSNPVIAKRVEVPFAMLQIVNEDLWRHWRWFKRSRLEVVLSRLLWWDTIRPLANGDVWVLEVPKVELRNRCGSAYRGRHIEMRATYLNEFYSIRFDEYIKTRPNSSLFYISWFHVQKQLRIWCHLGNRNFWADLVSSSWVDA